MFSGLTRQERKILLLLVIIIAMGIGIQKYYSRSGTRVDILTNRQSTEKTGEGEKASDSSFATHTALPPGGAMAQLVNINTASLEELRTLKGLGPTKAYAIIAYRNAHKGFKSIDELDNVPGIGPATLARVRDYVTVGEKKNPQSGVITPEKTSRRIPAIQYTPEPSPTPTPPPPTPTPIIKVNINRAGMRELMTLELIGEARAQKIIEYRKKNGPFRSPEDLTKVRSIGEKIYLLNKDRISIKNE